MVLKNRYSKAVTSVKLSRLTIPNGKNSTRLCLAVFASVFLAIATVTTAKDVTGSRTELSADRILSHHNSSRRHGTVNFRRGYRRVSGAAAAAADGAARLAAAVFHRFTNLNRHDLLRQCYGRYGCFSVDAPWFSSHRIVNMFPKGPDKIWPRFFLYTRRNWRRGQPLAEGSLALLRRSDFDPRR